MKVKGVFEITEVHVPQENGLAQLRDSLPCFFTHWVHNKVYAIGGFVFGSLYYPKSLSCSVFVQLYLDDP